MHALNSLRRRAVVVALLAACMLYPLALIGMVSYPVYFVASKMVSRL